MVIFIANMDETPVYMDVDKKGEKSIKVFTTKSEKCHVTSGYNYSINVR